MRKSYEVGISPKINLCNSVEVLTNSFGTVISGKQVLPCSISAPTRLMCEGKFKFRQSYAIRR